MSVCWRGILKARCQQDVSTRLPLFFASTLLLCRPVPPHIDVHSTVILPDANKLIALSSLSFSSKHVQDWVFPGKVFQG
ncbi:hypothetical protein E2C01_037009 [Portunus trituberculatus]|uniref:Uncharacterized protein n=1 Tax=Portunus trituberculatus TaxID=210409 RepID=A0A5B7FFX2_PORTR|nr:hypothetical protein [Portunus trituberculatus]